MKKISKLERKQRVPQPWAYTLADKEGAALAKRLFEKCDHARIDQALTGSVFQPHRRGG
jgi:hypothetical protein